jgi:hydroxymethylbilane synthase
MTSAATLRIGTRGSVLARTQAELVVAELEEATGTPAELITVRTLGDDHPGPLAQMPQPGVFVSALRDALSTGAVDAAVHSMKDLPSAPVDGIALAAVPRREDARDALVSAGGLGLMSLPHGARVGTGSPRRAARLRALRDDLELVDLRGNVDSRLARVSDGELDAVVLAVAGLARLGRTAVISEVLDADMMLPAPAQGALAIECRADDPDTLGLLRHLDDRASRLRALAERAVLAAVGATCSSAIGALAELDGARLTLRADASGPDGQHLEDRAEVETDIELEVGVEPAATGGADDGDASERAAIALGTVLAERLLAAGADGFLVR